MIRKGIYYRLKPGCFEEYRHLHQAVPPELLEIMKRHGLHNYSIFCHEPTGTLFGYLEMESEAEAAKIAEYPVARKWWKRMTQVLVCEHPGDPKGKEEEMTQVFYME